MDNNRKSAFLFLGACIPTRLFLAYLVKNSQKFKLRNILILITASISIGFLTIYTFGLRKTGAEVFGEKIWWNDLRPLHGILYGLIAFGLYKNNKDTWKLSFLDATIGLLAFLAHSCRSKVLVL